MEAALGAAPCFDGERFCVVDAVFAAVFRYVDVDVVESVDDCGFFSGAQSTAMHFTLASRPSVEAAVSEECENLLLAFLTRRDWALAKRIC